MRTANVGQRTGTDSIVMFELDSLGEPSPKEYITSPGYQNLAKTMSYGYDQGLHMTAWQKHTVTIGGVEKTFAFHLLKQELHLFFHHALTQFF